jgi:hypothetical protein
VDRQVPGGPSATAAIASRTEGEREADDAVDRDDETPMAGMPAPAAAPRLAGTRFSRAASWTRTE